MTSARTIRMAGFFSPLLLASLAAAQIGGTGADGDFRPTTSVTLDTSTRPGGFDFRSIDIPPGVRVTLIGTPAAILRSQGPVRIAGVLSADSRAGSRPEDGGIGGPGGFHGGNGGRGSGQAGHGPGGGAGGFAPFGGGGAGGHAAHATAATGTGGSQTTYGSAWPFDPRGGSGAGGSARPVSHQVPGNGGSGGGGTVVVLTDDELTVSGTVSARSVGMGSGGSIFLRAMRDVRVTGTVDASGRSILFLGSSGDGFVRIDSYGSAPTIQGTVKPQPLALELPAIRTDNEPRLGGTFRLRAASGPDDTLMFYGSIRSLNVPLPPLGILGIDPAVMILLGAASTTAAGFDPQAELGVPVPGLPVLRGLRFFVQALNPQTTATRGPRFSNTIAATVL